MLAQGPIQPPYDEMWNLLDLYSLTFDLDPSLCILRCFQGPWRRPSQPFDYLVVVEENRLRR